MLFLVLTRALAESDKLIRFMAAAEGNLPEAFCLS
jgi:hypothetical protein